VNPNAVKFEEISFDEVISRNLRVMDMTAITFCKDNNLPLRVFDLMADGNLGRALDGRPVGTLVK
jgi:uridylate kinase